MASSSPKRPRPSPSLASRSAASAKAIFTHELTRGVYQSLKEDVVRMEAYTAAIERACPGKRVLDIGTGPEALLAIVAARAGATAVIAVEVSDAAAAAAREAVRVAGLEGMITVLAGYSTELDLPAVDVVIHEIVGDLGSEEGIAAAAAAAAAVQAMIANKPKNPLSINPYDACDGYKPQQGQPGDEKLLLYGHHYAHALHTMNDSAMREAVGDDVSFVFSKEVDGCDLSKFH